jgi:hypothetical protein
MAHVEATTAKTSSATTNTANTTTNATFVASVGVRATSFIQWQGYSAGSRPVTPCRDTAPMVLMAPEAATYRSSTHLTGAAAPAMPAEPARPATRSAPNACGAGRAEEVLALLRAVGAPRPRYDPGLAGGLRAWLEDAAWSVTSGRGDGEPPFVLGPCRILRTPPGSWQLDRSEPSAREDRGANRLTRRLVLALFRHIVTTGSIEDPLSVAVDALTASGADDVLEQVRALVPAARTVLAESLALHARHLCALVPRFAPSWLPRTDDRVTIPLAGGRVVLRGVFDLLVGTPRRDSASLCALGVSTGGPWVHERRTLHYLALLETLRTGTPPFRLALLESASGRFVVEDVNEEHLASMTSHVVAWLTGGAEEHGG